MVTQEISGNYHCVIIRNGYHPRLISIELLIQQAFPLSAYLETQFAPNENIEHIKRMFQIQAESIPLQHDNICEIDSYECNSYETIFLLWIPSNFQIPPVQPYARCWECAGFCQG